MHPRNRYASKRPDFAALASAFPELEPFVMPGPRIDFGNRDAVAALTRALLHCDFGLDVDLPAGHLVPVIPQRLNYLLYLEDAIAASGLAGPVVGIDVGAGPACVYPLLACRMHPEWTFVATEADPGAATAARHCIERNCLADRVSVVEPPNPHSVLCGVVDTQQEHTSSPAVGGSIATFCMCNPPFFTPEEAKHPANRSGHRPERTQTPMTSSEMAFPGGEVAFVAQMISDSAILQRRIVVYSSMLGCKKSIAPLRTKLTEVNALCSTVFALVQGKTTRWVLAWTFDEEHGRAAIEHLLQCAEKGPSTQRAQAERGAKHPRPGDATAGAALSLTVSGRPLEEVSAAFETILDTLAIEHLVVAFADAGDIPLQRCCASFRTWQGRRKRRRLEKQGAPLPASSDYPSINPPLKFDATVRVSGDDKHCTCISFAGNSCDKQTLLEVTHYVRAELADRFDCDVSIQA
eukprot:m.30686 g.30686  ORF g.30686 m.30686 type:complete len:464 (-) comp5249_c0_seq2:52-1443(-)